MAITERARSENGAFLPSHGMTKTPLHRRWCAMRARCHNQHNKRYARYGARGITVCEEWDSSFEAFYKWALSNGYHDGLTIDRIDNDKGYSPENCRWVTQKEQNRNYSRNHKITYNGKTQCIADWADETGINRATILYRIKCGKTLDQIFDKKDGRTLRWKKRCFQGSTQ